MSEPITIEWFNPKYRPFIRHGRNRPDGWFMRYTLGEEPPRFKLPAIIGFTSDNRYQFDTRIRMDGMPLFRGYTWNEWYASSPFKID